MAIIGNEIWLEFHGGIRSNLHPSKIDESELSDGENFIARDGTVQMDQRYILAGETASYDVDAQGSGYGKYLDAEEYVFVVDNAVHVFDITSDLDRRFVITNEVIAEGDWFIEQFEQYLYFVSEEGGIGRKRIGVDEFILLRRPSRPDPPDNSLGFVATRISTFEQASYAGGTLVDSDGAGTNVSSTLDSNNNIVITTRAAGTYWVELTFDTSPDLRPDLSYRDIISFFISKSNSAIGIPEVSIFEGTDEQDTIYYGAQGGAANAEHYYRLQGISRTARNQVTKVRFTFTAPASLNIMTIGKPTLHRVWMSLPLSYTPPPWPTRPAFQPLKWAYTHYNQSTGFESEPSPTLTVPASHQLSLGQWYDIQMPGTAENGVSHMRVYRVVGETGAEAFYRLGEVANPSLGLVVFRDKLALDEVTALDIMLPGLLENDGITAIGVWQGRLCLGVGNLVEISRSDDELSFPSLAGNLDEFDVGNGLTFFCDDKKAERVIGLAAGDALTVVTNRSVRALFGTIPQNWRYVKLNSPEGAVGPRAWTPYRDGVILLTPSGRLLYIALGMNEPANLGHKIRDRIGDLGLKALATSDAVVAVRPDGQIEVRNQAGRYYIIDMDGSVRKGTHSHPTHSALFVSGLPVRWMGTNGKLYEGGNDAYVTDGGVEGDSGLEVEWYVDTREYSLPRNAVENVWLNASESIRQPTNEVLFPKVSVISRRRTKEYVKEMGKDTIKCSVLDSGERTKFRLRGDRHTQYIDVRVRIKSISRGDHL